MSYSLGVIFPKYRSSNVSRMCVASFSTTQHTTEKGKSQGHGAAAKSRNSLTHPALRRFATTSLYPRTKIERPWFQQNGQNQGGTGVYFRL